MLIDAAEQGGEAAIALNKQADKAKSIIKAVIQDCCFNNALEENNLHPNSG
jgi:hypothetical protein